MSLAQQIVVLGLLWSLFVGIMLGALVTLISQQNHWRKNVMREFDHE